jgi:putative sugar O-methyltransferase
MKTIANKISRHLLSIYLSWFLPKADMLKMTKIHNEAITRYKKDSPTYHFDDFVMPEWKKNTEVIEHYFLNQSLNSFLQHPLIKSTMFAHLPRQATEMQKKLIIDFFGLPKAQLLLRESMVGSPILNDQSLLTSGNSIHHLYHLTKFAREMNVIPSSISSVIEFGGGYGNLAKLARRINPSITYTIIDVPIFIYLQYVYLACLFGQDLVTIVDSSMTISEGKFNLVPLDKILLEKFTVQKPTADLFVSTWALSESNVYTQSWITEQDYFGAKNLLLAYQKANDSFTFAENVVKLNANYQVKYNAVTEYIPDNYYLFAQRHQ